MSSPTCPTFIRQNPHVAIDFMKVMADRVITMNDRLAELDESQSNIWKLALS